MITTHQCANGLAVVVEEIEHVASAAYSFHIPGGILHDHEERVGEAHILTELTSRGAGVLDSRALSDSFDELGIRHSESAAHNRFVYRGSLLAEHLPRALELVASMALKPTFPQAELESIRSLYLQDVYSLKDNPGRWAMTELTQRYYPEPYNRPSIGTEEGLQGASIESLRDLWARCYSPVGSVLSVAGNVSAQEVIAQVESVFSGWKGDELSVPEFSACHDGQRHHINSDSAQEQIVLAFPAPKFLDELYYPAKVANSILSGGMFGRLFIEVREKRGLCYTVYSRHSANNDYGTTVAYAGTTPERAHETLEVMLEQLGSVEGLTEEELGRAKANLLSSIVIGEESVASRCGSNASDWWLLKRIRGVDEISAALQAVTSEQVYEVFQQFPASRYSLLTLGQRDLADKVGA